MSIPDRIEHLLSELTQRYELTDEFAGKLRPMIATIFSDEIRDEDRTQLLEMVAETCERDLRMRRGSVKLKECLQTLMSTLHELNQKLRTLSDRPGPPPASDGDQRGAA